MDWMILPLKRYAEFQGRSRRMEYWMFYLFQILIGVGFAILGGIVGAASGGLGGTSPFNPSAATGGSLIVSLLNMLVSLALLVPAIAVGVRRLHDTDRTGWWLLAPVIPGLFTVIAIFASLGAALGSGSPNFGAAFAGGVGISLVIGLLATLALGVTVFVFTVLEGTRGPNRYGSDPKNPEGDLTSVFR